MKIINIVGARPNFMKIAPLMRAYSAYPSIEPLLVHTGQHYDRAMSELFFDQLQIPKPDMNLEVGSGSHAWQTAQIMMRFEPICLEHKPDLVLVLGDVNSTIACSLVAAKLGIPIAHVEAGLRSFDRGMPEEINRVLTDALSDLLFVTEPSGVQNLQREGVSAGRIHFVGNVMIDTLLTHRERAQTSSILSDLDISAGGYGVVTLHRPSNVDDPAIFGPLLKTLSKIAEEIPLVMPVHPRTRKRAQELGLLHLIEGTPRFRLTEPLGYLDFLKLTSNARVVLTDSGGIQEETTVLKVPCITLRENTERPVTITSGCNQLVGTSPERILAAFEVAKTLDPAQISTPEGWDGHAAERIVEILVKGSTGTGG